MVVLRNKKKTNGRRRRGQVGQNLRRTGRNAGLVSESGKIREHQDESNAAAGHNVHQIYDCKTQRTETDPVEESISVRTEK